MNCSMRSGSDPFVIAECLARPALAERLLTHWYASDQRIHSEAKHRAEVELQTHPTVEQMKQLSGTYSEMELIKDNTVGWAESSGPEHAVKLNNDEWDNTLQKLAAMFLDHPVAGGATLQIKTGLVSALQEDETRYYATAVIEKTDKGLKLASVSWAKDPLQSWLSRMENQLPSTSATTDTGYALPKISDGAGCIDDTWTATAGPPDSRFGHTAVWTGGEMIVWGGYDGTNDFNSGYRYDPATDTWTATSTDQCTHCPRISHSNLDWQSDDSVGRVGSRCQLSEHWRAIRPGHRHLDCYQHNKCAHWPIRSHCSVDRQRDDCVGRL